MGTIDAIFVHQEPDVTKAKGWRTRLRMVAVSMLGFGANRRAKRRSRSALRELTPDQLRDVGLTPGDVRREVAKSFFWG